MTRTSRETLIAGELRFRKFSHEPSEPVVECRTSDPKSEEVHAEH